MCLRDDDFEKRGVELANRFEERGYSHDCIECAYTRAKKMNRKDLMVTRKNKRTNNQERYITPFNCKSHIMRQILHKHWDILRMDDSLKN